MTLWIRVDVSTPRDPVIAELADVVGESLPSTVGHVTMVWCVVAEHAPTGDITRVSVSTIEQWAGWQPKRGKPAGTFGRAFLTLFTVQEEGRTMLLDWPRRQGKLIELAERERDRWHRRGTGNPPPPPRGDSAESPEDSGADSQATVRNTTPHNTTTSPDCPPFRGTSGVEVSTEAPPREDVAIAETPRSPRRGRALVPTEDEQRVLDHYRTVHPRRGTHDDKQIRKVRAALQAFSVDQLCQAIDGNHDDAWHAERRKHELTYVLRDHDMIAHFVDLHEHQNAPLVGAGGEFTDAGRLYFGNVR